MTLDLCEIIFTVENLIHCHLIVALSGKIIISRVCAIMIITLPLCTSFLIILIILRWKEEFSFTCTVLSVENQYLKKFMEENYEKFMSDSLLGNNISKSSNNVRTTTFFFNYYSRKSTREQKVIFVRLRSGNKISEKDKEKLIMEK